MKYLVTILLVFLLINRVSAQEKHFVFIQSDNQQPFYVSVNGKIYSSSSTGYVIIPKLADGSYNLTVGFAQNASPEQKFAVSINQKDLGYNLKNFGEKGFGLFNLQTLDVTMASNDSGVGALSTGIKNNPNDDVISFPARRKDTAVARIDTKQSKKKAPVEPVIKTEQTSVLAGGKDSAAIGKANVNLDSLPKADIAAQQTPVVNMQSSETISVTKDTVVTRAQTTASSSAEPAHETVSTTPGATTASDVKKVSEKKSDEGVFLSFVDSNGKKTDTVQVIIPATKSSTSSAPVTASPKADVAATNTESVSTSAANPAPKKEEPKFLDVNMNTSKKDSVESVSKQEEAISIMPNSNCKNIANDDDYTRLRKKMAQETTDEKMIAEAKKYYRDKCFTTAQIKRLSTLFLSDEGRLNFFNASFLSVADSAQYPTLQSEFIDPAFVTRFKTLFQ